MEQDLSFVLLIIAGLILLILFIYSLKTRVRPGKRTEVEHNILDPLGQDESDILSMPLNSQAQEPYIETKQLVDEPPSVELEVQAKETIEVIEKSEPQELESTEVVKDESYSKLIVINVLPQEGRKFIGYELLQALLSANLRHGSMSIFHRYETAMGEGKILFSVAQATEPGTFNMDAMGTCQCSGLTVFMQLMGPEHDLKAFEVFIQTAQQIADNLRGVLVDQNQKALTAESTRVFKSQVQAHLRSLSRGAV